MFNIATCRYLYMEMDSMDQAKCALPHFQGDTKDLDDKATVATVVTNVRVPGVCMLDYVYNNNLPHDSNTNVTILHKYV